MTSSLPESIDGLYRFSSFSDAVSSQTSLSINPDTLWSKLNECDKCVFLEIWFLNLYTQQTIIMQTLMLKLFLFLEIPEINFL